jgi:AcrR family transcriptional regulator
MAPTRTRVSPPRGQTLTTRKKILRQSVDVASTEGLEGLTIGRLAGELEMSKSGLFAHFGSKEELQLATVQAAIDIFIATVIAPANEAAEGAPRLRALCDRYLDHLEREVFPGGCFLAQAGHEFDGRPGPVRDALGSALSAWLSLLQGQAEVAGAEDPARLAFELHSIGLGANTGFQLLGDRRVFAFARDSVDERLSALG